MCVRSEMKMTRVTKGPNFIVGMFLVDDIEPISLPRTVNQLISIESFTGRKRFVRICFYHRLICGDVMMCMNYLYGCPCINIENDTASNSGTH